MLSDILSHADCDEGSETDSSRANGSSGRETCLLPAAGCLSSQRHGGRGDACSAGRVARCSEIPVSWWRSSTH
ncbi:hypothetical protein HBI38_078160 [Parastagonospora nodorum]|nr:hypothetical protein HBH51_246050 [Parastagonospora nodorum]KAH4001528.1 hypothetical protein HBI10_089880 [Parastagonospora nodorum]KAH4027419.1 hypothetical protein HBI13_058900 [Parastagonospora nodorum]KAH4390146.1 hypothetical protein HBH97_048760 [Parastagonospora nodorum]KAH4414999.1 hypothetical protein HBH99_067580 [Parastagonospora nodorum]